MCEFAVSASDGGVDWNKRDDELPFFVFGSPLAMAEWIEIINKIEVDGRGLVSASDGGVDWNSRFSSFMRVSAGLR